MTNEQTTNHHPRIIQGGMGIGVSDWRLARAVSLTGELGVISGTCIDTVFIRRLQEGDLDGQMRRAISNFPLADVSAGVLKRFFIEGGKSTSKPYQLLPMHQSKPNLFREQVTVLASFVETFLAKEGHQGKIGINLLTKIQMPTLATLYGAMLGGIDYVLMGAGIPREIPGTLDLLATHKKATLKLEVQDAKDQSFTLEFDPIALGYSDVSPLRRPFFLPIISSHSLATMLARKATGRIDGFIIEHNSAGGHNAPPREAQPPNHTGEPIYGIRDEVDLEKVKELGLPFWLAGGYGTPESINTALALGAAGVQVGTLFAFCTESGITAQLKKESVTQSLRGKVKILTDSKASPTGYPFKVVELDNTLSNSQIYAARPRQCDLGYLRTPYRRPDGRIGFRCSGEPIQDFLSKGGSQEDTIDRKCLCNALFANIGKGQMRSENYAEPALLTSGDQLKSIGTFLKEDRPYSAKEVVDYLLQG